MAEAIDYGDHAPATKGLITPGNLDLSNRPVIKNNDGTTSTVRTITIEENGKTILIPTAVNGKIVSDDEAINQFHKTGQHMGIFDTEDNAENYDKNLHTQMGWNGAPGSAQAKWQASANSIDYGDHAPAGTILERAKANLGRSALNLYTGAFKMGGDMVAPDPNADPNDKTPVVVKQAKALGHALAHPLDTAREMFAEDPLGTAAAVGGLARPLYGAAADATAAKAAETVANTAKKGAQLATSPTAMKIAGGTAGAYLGHLSGLPEGTFLGGLAGREVGSNIAGKFAASRKAVADLLASKNVQEVNPPPVDLPPLANDAPRVPVQPPLNGQGVPPANTPLPQDAPRPPLRAPLATGAPQPAVTVPPAPEPAVEPTTQTADVPSVAPQASVTLLHGSPNPGLKTLQPGSMLSDQPEWAAGYTTKFDNNGAESFSGKIHSAEVPTGKSITVNSLHNAESWIFSRAEELSGRSGLSLPEASKIVNSKDGIESLIVKQGDKIRGAITLRDVPVSSSEDPIEALQALKDKSRIPSNLQGALDRQTPQPASQDLSALSPEDKFQALRKSLVDKGILPAKGPLGGAPARARFDEGGPSVTVKPDKTVTLKNIPADSPLAKNLKALEAAKKLAAAMKE